MKKTSLFIIVVFILLGLSVPAIASSESVDIQGAVIKDGRTLVPVRGIFELLGYDVNWEQSTRTATLSNSSNNIMVTVDSPVFIMNGKARNLDVPAQIIGDRTMLPLRAVGEAIGADVRWDGNARIATISIENVIIRVHAQEEAIKHETPSPSTTELSDRKNNPLEFVKSSYDNSFGLKNLTLTLKNKLGKDISGFSYTVACYDVYRQPVIGLFTNESKFTNSSGIKADEQKDFSCSLIYHSTVKIVNIAITKYITSDGEIVEIPKDKQVWKAYNLPD